jgi:hypothetical protein
MMMKRTAKEKHVFVRILLFQMDGQLCYEKQIKQGEPSMCHPDTSYSASGISKGRTSLFTNYRATWRIKQ